MPIPFNEKELEVIGEAPSFFGPPTPIYNYPVTPREAFRKMYERDPVWECGGGESSMFAPAVIPDNVARGFVFDGSGHPPAQDKEINPDMFGIEWEYVQQVGGSMVRPGKPLMEDANEWREKVKFPDIDKWDWEGAAKANANFFRPDQFHVAWFLTGWFERLISFMDFEAAAYALIDEDQQDAVKELFFALSDLYIKIFDKMLQYFPEIDSFCIHDDWAGQKSTFFSPATAAEVIVPAMRKVTDHLHAKGIWCDLHSCGQELLQIPNFIKGGWDSWTGQAMNDTHLQYELYGDKIILGVMPDPVPEGATEEEARALARDFANKFCSREKISTASMYGAGMTRAYREELYKQSRINYSK
ncbi:MAG: methyltransferase [Oscillospiraceae bacterium]|jgi:hypothetical protein|nr:methyltransferase [Oscillospiraceae bacterium]